MTDDDTTSRDTWTARDYPVLVAAADHLERTQGRACQPHELARNIGMSSRDVTSAVMVLVPDYLTGEVYRNLGDEVDAAVTGLTSEGRREAGLWPKKADHLASLIEALEAAAERTDDAEQRSTLGSIGDGLKAAPGSVLSGVLTAWLASQGGI